jgi:hypothetical protein
MANDRSETARPEPAAAAPTESLPEWLRGSVASRDRDAGPLIVTGHLRGIDAEGRPLFQPEGAPDAVAVGIACDLADGAIVRAARRQSRALVLRTTDATPRLVLVGLVRERVPERSRDARPGRLELKVDGEKVSLEAEHDIELKCGAASITLRYDGRVEIRGTHILSASRGPNRVKGATIALN